MVGTSEFRVPGNREEFISAVALHDAGWVLHDRAPTVDGKGLPTDVFESPRELGLAVWPGAVSVAAREGPRAELLVSIHVLTLSAYASSESGMNKAGGAGALTAVERFELNKFQHREFERQRRLREVLGLSLELPLTLGLYDPETEDEDGPPPLPPQPPPPPLPVEVLRREQELVEQYRWLQALDLISLAVCCTTVPVARTPEVLSSGREDVWESLRLVRDGADLRVKPWPFRVERIEVAVPYRVVGTGPYRDAEELREAYAAAEREVVRAVVLPG